MKKRIIRTGAAILGAAYAAAKLRPVQNKVTFISRQQDTPPLDIEMLGDHLTKSGVECITLCRRLGDGIPAKIGYSLHMVRQMYHMSNSRLIVLDSYSILASMLKHRQETKVVQMWHALGSMKKFGKSILGRPEGRDPELAKAMKMHANYDVIFTSSEASRNAFAEAFGYRPEKLTVMSLPRVDAILDMERDAELKKQITDHYPELAERKNILYAPTFREGADMTEAYRGAIESVDTGRFNLILKTHPAHDMSINWEELREVGDREGDGVIIIDKTFTTMDLFAVTDYMITDYSALTFEAAVKGLPTYFYAYDLEEYIQGRSFYLDYESEMPGLISADITEIMRAIERNEYDSERIKTFADKYIENKKGCTKKIGEFLISIMSESSKDGGQKRA